MSDIKETKEFLSGILAAATVITELVLDGVDLQDVFTLVTKVQHDKRFKNATEGMEKIPDELSDLTSSEILELVSHIVNESKALIDTLTQQ